MHPAIGRLLEKHGGVVTRDGVLAVVAHYVLDHAITRGYVIRIFPRTFAEPHAAADPAVRRVAALRYARGCGALSHATALTGWLLPVAEQGTVHITTGNECQLRGAPGLRVHRRKRFRVEAPWTVARNGLAHVRLERALVESWPQLSSRDRRAPLILSVQRRLTSPDRLLAEAAQLPRLKDRAALLQLVELLRAGCHSELEIWGYLHVFNAPLLPVVRRQARILIGGRTAYLDLAYDREMVNVELDGAEYHGPTLRREGDIRRDAALAAMGWLTVRFSHARLHEEPDVIRRELLDTLEVRRSQLHCG